MAARPWEACGEIKFQFAARSKEPNSLVAFHTGKDGPRGTPRGGGPLGGARAARQAEGLCENGSVTKRQRLFHVHFSR